MSAADSQPGTDKGPLGLDASAWSRLRPLLDRALDLPGSAGTAWIEAELAAEPALLAAARELLGRSGPEHGFLDPTSTPLPPSGPEAGPAVSVPGTYIGGFRVLRVLGRGGMGTVYEAEQVSPRRRVALKVLARGIEDARALRRFQYEAEVLGLLQHPGIAQIHASGIEEREGERVPWIAMEYVEGASTLSQWVESSAPDLRTKVELLSRVCDAVQASHQHGVIHRDLKPGNILIDPRGAPKLIDFGIARAIASDETPATLQTQAGEIFGTLQYMSPEQLAGDPRLVDTRTDVYALGAVLYELVAGRPLHDLQGMSLGASLALLRAEEDAPRLADAALPRELGWICSRALERERERRYATAQALALDLRRFLAGEPVEAGPASRAYRLRKLARKHRVLLSAAVLVLLALVGGTAAALVGLQRARVAEKSARADQERAQALALSLSDALRVSEARLAEALKARQDELAQADSARAELRNRYFQEHRLIVERVARQGAVDLWVGSLEHAQHSDRPVLRTALQRAAGLLAADEMMEPEAKLELHRTLGRAWIALGEPGRAMLHFHAGLALARRTLGFEHSRTAELGVWWSKALLACQPREAEIAETQGVVEAALALQGDLQRHELAIVPEIQLLLAKQGLLARAEILLCARRDELVLSAGPEDPAALDARWNVALWWWCSGRRTEALDELRPIYQARVLQLGQLDPVTHEARWGLLLALTSDRVEIELLEADELAETWFEAANVNFGPDAPETLEALEAIGRIRLLRGEVEDGRAKLALASEKGLDKEALHGSRTLRLLESLDSGSAGGDLQAAVDLDTFYCARQGEPRTAAQRSRARLARASAHYGADAEAIALSQFDAAREADRLASGARRLSLSSSSLGILLLEHGQPVAAHVSLRQALDVCRAQQLYVPEVRRIAYLGAVAAHASGQEDDWLAKVCAPGVEEQAGLSAADFLVMHCLRSDLLARMGKAKQGRDDLEAAWTATRAKLGDSHPAEQFAFLVLADVCESDGRAEEARAWRGRIEDWVLAEESPSASQPAPGQGR